MPAHARLNTNLGLRTSDEQKEQREAEKLREELGSKASHGTSSLLIEMNLDRPLVSLSKEGLNLEAGAVYMPPLVEATKNRIMI
jgi:hypothetical protein